jgi:hypothetical protein
MRLLAAILCICLCYSSTAQQLNLTSLQHEVRWLDEIRFPPFVKDPVISKDLLANATATLSRKLNVEPGTMPVQVDYKLINMFGKPRPVSPAKSADPNHYQASVLSFITRATNGFEVFWEMKAEIRQNGKVIFSRETRHELLNYEPGFSWFSETSFKQHFSILLEELLELRPPLSQKYVLGEGIDYADLLRTDGQTWDVTKNPNLLGFGQPSFGPYTTLGAGKLDSPVIRMNKVLGTESSLGFYSGKGMSFDQFKTVDLSKRKICFLQLATVPDTLEAIYSVITRNIGARRTFLSNLLSDDDDEFNTPPSISNRNIMGVIRTDTVAWEFMIQSYQSDGTIGGGYLKNDQINFQLVYKQHTGMHREILCTGQNGEYFASLDMRSSATEIRIRNNLDRATTHAISVLYAVLMSTWNVQ